MTLVTLLTELARLDIRLWLDDNQLRFSAPDGVMNESLIADIRSQKPAIIEFLQKNVSESNLTIDPVPRQQTGYPTAYAQQRFWFLQQINPDDTAYHIHTALSVKGNLDRQRLETALNGLYQRHEILRTRYTQIDGQLMQQPIEPVPFSLNETEITALECKQMLIDHIKRPFDLSMGDILHVDLFRVSESHCYLAFTVHHIASDGWSLNNLIKELVTAYHDNKPLPEPALQYLDYASWQQSTALQQADIEYWQQQLNTVPVLQLPVDFHPDAISGDNAPNNEAKSHTFHLDTTTLEALKQLAGDESSSLFVLLMTLYAVLLQKYTHQPDFAIGTAVAGRQHSQLENMPGCFINTLAIRFDMDIHDTFRQLLRNSKDTVANALMHQSVPFEHIIKVLKLPYDEASTPVFQTLFSLQDNPFTQVDTGTLLIEAEPAAYTAAQFDLKLTAMEAHDRLACCFEYKQSRFNASNINRMSQHFIALIKATLVAPDTPLSQLSLDNNQTGLLLGHNDFNDTETVKPHLSVHQLFQQQVEKTPEAIAVSDTENNRLSYRELDNKANQLAHALQAKGIEANAIIGLCLQRSIAVIISQLAILKSGCAYLPLEPDLPRERQQKRLDQANACCLITDTDQDLHTPCDTVRIDTFIFDDYPASSLCIDNQDGLFNLIFTSGSTGEPKGIMMGHQAIANRLLWMQKRFALTAKDTVLQKTPYGFDVSVWEFFWPLIAGSRCHFMPPEAHKDPVALRHVIDEAGITCVHFVPSMLTPFLAQIHNHCQQLRYVFCSGEALSIPQMQQCLRLLPTTELYNLYGPTEAAIDVSYYRCQASMTYPSVPIGKPIDNIQLHVLDANLQPVPIGIAGELYIAGTGLAQGYINNAQQTAQAFIDNPFVKNGHPSPKLYRTGDWVKMTDDNQLLYLGRMDTQIKLRGQRIELTDIEHTLTSLLAIDQAVVLLRKHPKTQDDTLLAYVPVTETASIKSQLAKHLPQAMIPGYFIPVSNWPLTASGKIDRKRLPDPDWTLIESHVYKPAQTETEKTLVTIWQESLGIDRIGVLDDFFDLGGHSLKAIDILARTEAQFGIEIPLKSIFANPNIEAIAAFIDNHLIAEAVFSDNQPTDDDDTDSFII